jgi:tetratricopeptide (TPR) repeat protein
MPRPPAIRARARAMRTRLAIGAASAFLLALGAFGLLARGGGETASARRPAPAPQLPPPGATTDQRIAALRGIVRARPLQAEGYTLLAGAYAQKVRETGDAQFYVKASGLLRRALALRPGDAAALTQRGALELSRHDFRAALRDARAARRAAPDVDKPFGVLVDALIELGRYRSARRTLQQMVDRKPDLGAYARVSYWRELHGDIAGARRAMALAASAGGDAPENAASIDALLSHLDLMRGHLHLAARDARAALFRFPGHPAAEAALARVHVARGDVGGAIARLEPLVARLPLPEYVIALGEAQSLAGRHAAARREFALVRAEQRLLAGAGVNTDTELALFEADHGSPPRAVRLARRAWDAAPSVRSADALGWALTRAGRPHDGLHWARRSLALGTRDPAFLAHAGLAARAAGRASDAARWLRAARRSPALSPILAREVGR